MKKLLLPVFCLLLLNCHSGKDILPVCNVTKPLEELSWLKAIVAADTASKYGYTQIAQATYKGRIVYQVDITPGPDAGTTTLYDCQGTVLCKGYTTIAGFRSDCKSVFDETQGYSVLYTR